MASSSISISIPRSQIQVLEQIFSREDTRYTKKVKAAVASAGLVMQTVAKKESEPIDKGRLRSSINTVITDKGLNAVTGTNVEYAIYVNNGTSRMQGRHYMEKGLAAGKRTFYQKMK